MTEWKAKDYFSDPDVNHDPYPYFEALRSECPVLPLPHHGIVAVTGYDEVAEVYRDPDTFSSCNSTTGPYAIFPVPLEGDDVSEIVAEYRHRLPFSKHMITMDPPDHTRERALLMRLMTPKRMKENEAFIVTAAERQLSEFVSDGRCEFISAYAEPFTMLVIADLLGVPEADHPRFREAFSTIELAGEKPAQVSQDSAEDFLGAYFTEYVENRRLEPQDDILTELALATYPDGSTPPVRSVVRTSAFLFSAGQETTARLLATSLMILCEQPELQDQLRGKPERIADFIDETLRLDAPVKTTFRLARRSTSIGGVPIAAGTPLMVLNAAANRDPRAFECPAEFHLDRPSKAHTTFGRGVHSCPGGPLARVEGHVSIERILERTRDLKLSEEHHGTPGNERFDYEMSWIVRGLSELHLEFTPVAGGRAG